MFIIHEADYTGAPLVILNYLKWLEQTENNSLECYALCLKDGPLKSEIINVTKETIFYNNKESLIDRVLKKIKIIRSSDFNIKRIKNYKFDLIYCNSIASFDVALNISLKLNLPILVHIHEMNLSSKFNSRLFFKQFNQVIHFICVSKTIEENLLGLGISEDKISTITPFVDLKRFDNIKTTIKKEYDKFVVCGSGNLYWAKNPEGFIQVAKIVKSLLPNERIEFHWIGVVDGQSRDIINTIIDKADLCSTVKFLDKVVNPIPFFENANVFLLTSIEDSFPLVCLEAGLLGKPVICFENTTGIVDLIRNGGGKVIPFLDYYEMAKSVVSYYLNRVELEQHGTTLKKRIKKIDFDEVGSKMSEVILNSVH